MPLERASDETVALEYISTGTAFSLGVTRVTKRLSIGGRRMTQEYQKSRGKLASLHASLQADHGEQGDRQVQQAIVEHSAEVFSKPRRAVELD